MELIKNLNEETKQDNIKGLVSVIIPTYNREHSLQHSINSMLEQSHVNWELIIVDDCSTDNTATVVGNYRQNDKRIFYLRLNRNSGACVARNEGILLAKGEYITFLDSDDEYLPTKIEKQLSHFLQSSNENLGVVSCGRIDYRGKKEYRRDLPECKNNYFKSLLAKERGIGAGTPFLMVKSSIIKENKIFFDPQMPAMQDWDFVIRICKNHDFEFVSDYLVKVNHHENDRVYNASNAIKAIEIQYDKYENWLLNDPDSHKKFVKRAGVIMAHHISIVYAINFLNFASEKFNGQNKLEIQFFKSIIKLFKFRYFKLFYMKFY